MKYFCFYHPLLIASILLLTPMQTAAAEKAQGNDLPLPARLIILKVNPMIEAQRYGEAIELLLAFQARGGSKGDPKKDDPKGYHHPEIYFTLGNCYLLQDNFQQAIEAYRSALEKDSSNASAWLNLAKANYELNRYTEAGNCFGKGYETATEKKPDVLYYAAASYMMAGNNRRAIEIFEKLFSAHPSDIKLEWKEYLVHALLATDQPRRALPTIRELAFAYTGDKQVQWQEILLYQYLQLKMSKEALALARSLTRNSPTVDKWWKALAHVQLDSGRQEEALMAMTIYSFLKPLSWEEKKLLADLEMQEGIPVKAGPLYEACLDEKPNKETLQRLVAAYQQLGRPQKALDAIDKFDMNSNDEGLLLLQGDLYYSIERFDLAADSYEKAAKQKGRQTGRAWLMAGYSAWQRDDITASKAAFLKAAKYKKQKKAANTALKQLDTVVSK